MPSWYKAWLDIRSYVRFGCKEKIVNIDLKIFYCWSLFKGSHVLNLPFYITVIGCYLFDQSYEGAFLQITLELHVFNLLIPSLFSHCYIFDPATTTMLKKYISRARGVGVLDAWDTLVLLIIQIRRTRRYKLLQYKKKWDAKAPFSSKF